MTANTSQRLDRSVKVTPELLRDLDGLIRRDQSYLIDKLAVKYEINKRSLANFVNKGSRPKDERAAVACDLIKDQFNVTYLIHWKNEISLKVVGVEAAIDALSVEHVEPRSIEIEYGSYGIFHVSIAIDDRFSKPVNINIRAPLDRITVLRDLIVNIVKNNSPEYQIFHSRKIKGLITFSPFVLIPLLSIFLGALSTSNGGVREKIYSISTVVALF